MAERNERVEVRTRFDGGWVGGFEIVERHRPRGDGDVAPRVTVRRRSDGRVLPERFASDEVRPDR
jgi:hypothetical protein